MGLTKILQNKLREKVQNYKQERTERKQNEQLEKAEYKRGFYEANKKSAYERGKAAGSGKHVQGVTGRGVIGGIGGFSEGVSKGLKSYDGVFGVSGSGGFGLGFGDEPRKQRVAPQRITTVSRSGTVKITEPVQSQPQKEQEYDAFFGPSQSSNKKEKHPYDIF